MVAFGSIYNSADYGRHCIVFRFGLEAALLAAHGMEGNHDILDMTSGFGAFYPDYDPEGFLLAHSTNSDFILHSQVGHKQTVTIFIGRERQGRCQRGQILELFRRQSSRNFEESGLSARR